MKRVGFVWAIWLFIISQSSMAYWDINIFRGKDAPKGTQEWGLLERYVATEAGPFSIATLSTVVFLKNSQEPATEDALAKKMETMIQGLKWQKEIYKGVSIYTAYLKRDLRYFKMMVKDQGKKRIYTLATIRQPYVLGTSLETEFLQRLFMKRHLETGRSKKKKTALLWDFVLPEAEAVTSGSDYARMIDAYLRGLAREVGADGAKGLVNAADRLTSSVTRVGSDGVSVLSTAVGVGQQAVNQIPSAVGAVNNVADSMDRFTTGLDADTNKLVQTAKEVSRGISSDVTRVLNKVTDPKLIAKLGAAAGLGFSIGSYAGTVLTTLISEGAFKLVRESYYYLKGELKPEIREKMEGRALGALDRLSNSMKAINQLNIDIGTLGMALSKVALKPGVNLVETLGIDRVRYNLEIDQLKSRTKDLHKLDDMNSCATDLYRLNEQVFLTDNLIPIFWKIGNEGKDGHQVVCEAILEKLRAWREAAAEANRAKNEVTIEMMTLLSASQRAEVGSKQKYASTSFTNRDCRNNVQIRIDMLEEEYAKYDCTLNPGGSGCPEFKKTIAEAAKEKDECNELAEMIEGANDIYSSTAALKAANSGISIARENIQAIARLDCKKNDGRSICKATGEGDMAALERLYVDQFNLLKKKCPNTAFNDNVSPVYDQEDLSRQFPDPKAPIAAAPPPPPPEPDSIWTKLVRWFKNLW